MTDKIRRLLLWAIVVSVAVVPPAVLLELGYTHYVSTTVQLAGGLIAGCGLLLAYARATNLAARVSDWWNRFRRRPNDIIISPAPAFIGVGTLSADTYANFQLGETATLEQQLTQLEQYVRELRGMFVPVNAAIRKLDNAIKEATTHADTAAAQALTEAKAALKSFSDEFNKTEGFDLSIAAAGAFIMAAGYVLSYFGCLRF